MYIAIALVLLAYLSGAVPYGLIVARLKGVDLREIGSGNIGATNAARALGKRWGIIILVLDALKGFIPVLLVRYLLPTHDLWLAATMLAAVLGHVFSIFVRFRGGKGVATGLGVILATSPWAALIGLGLYAFIYGAFRLSSLGSLAAALTVPTLVFLFGGPQPVGYAVIIICLLILATHRNNIKRLIKGEEKKL